MLRDRLKAWFLHRRERRQAIGVLAWLFEDERRLAGTSLKRRHANRTVYLGHDADTAGALLRIRFGILRHPRPYRYSRQHHKVVEFYTYEIADGHIGRERGFNLTRAEGRDAD